MAMGIVSDDEFDKEATKLSNPISEVKIGQVIEIERGRGHNKQVPESLRKIIGETGSLDSRQEALSLAHSLGISSSSASAYANGANSTSSYNEPNEELKNHIDETRNRIQRKARGRLMNALKHITDDKLSSAKVRDVSAVAKDMSSIIKDFEEDKEQSTAKSAPQFIFYAPQIRDEKTFDVIRIKE